MPQRDTLGTRYDDALFADLLPPREQAAFSRFKAKLLDGGCFSGLSEARFEINHHIAYYNAERRHSSLGHLAPTTSERNFKPGSSSAWRS